MIEEIISDHQREIERNRAITNKIFCLHHLLDKMGSEWGSTSAIYKIPEGL